MNDLPWTEGRVCQEFQKIQESREEIFRQENGEKEYLNRLAEHVSNCRECFGSRPCVIKGSSVEEGRRRAEEARRSFDEMKLKCCDRRAEERKDFYPEGR